MGISLIALVAFSACTDDVDGDRDTGLAGHRLSFIVSMEGEEAQTRADGSGTTTATQYFDPVELKGKQGGKSVYLQAEETDGFPDDGQPLTRGTQINTATSMNAFAVSAYTSVSGTPDHMYNVKVEKKSSEWNPDGDYTWPEGKKLHFYAWYPYEASSLSVTDENTAGAPVLTYTVPEKVEDQQDVMTALKYNQSEGVGGTRLQFQHTLSAVRFISGSGLSTCTLHHIKLKGVKYKGSWRIGAQGWTLENETTDYTLTLEKDMDGTPNTPITEGDQTLLLMPQVFEDENAELEVNMTVGLDDYTFTAKLKDIVEEWKPGKTYTYKISDSLSDILNVDVNFFKGTRGPLGTLYTIHNISANGDPYTIDITYPNPNYMKKITARFIYTANGNNVIEDNIDLTGQTSVSRTSLCMNNTGTPSKAKSITTSFAIQIKIESDIKVNITSSGNSAKQVYNPVTNNETWYTIWSGSMFPPNYIDQTYKVIMSRNDLLGTNTRLMTQVDALSKAAEYYEIHSNHPTYGKGKWSLPSGSIDSASDIHKMDILANMIRDDAPPAGNALYGEAANIYNSGTGGTTNNSYYHTRRHIAIWSGSTDRTIMVRKTTERSYDPAKCQLYLKSQGANFTYAQFTLADPGVNNRYAIFRARTQIEY